MAKTHTIGIIVFDGVLTSEVIGPAEVFGVASQRAWFKDANVILIGIEKQATVRTAEGLGLCVDATLDDDLTLDVLLVPGGGDMKALRAHEALNKFIQKQEENAQWVGSICSGAFLLAQARVLDGKQATTWFGGETKLQQEFPAVQVIHDKPVVVDKRCITANGGLVSYRAALVLLGQLTSAANAKEIYNQLGISRLGSWRETEASISDRPA
jgi:transcriptional regulator GlxA family with amidase domain